MNRTLPLSFRRAWLAVALAFLCCGALAPAARASVPSLMNYQGYLADNAGVPLTGAYAITFKLYADSTIATPLWTESYSSVSVNAGVFNVLLGSVSPLGPSILNGSKLWLLTTVNGNDVLPRRPVVTVAYAFRSAVAESALKAAPGTGDITGQVSVSCAGGSGGVLVYIPGRSFIAYTASDGTFDLGAVPPGTYTVHVVSASSGTTDVANVTVTAGAVTNAGVVSVGANLQTDVNNCGACGNVCSTNNDVPSCVSGTCQVACNAGYANCDASPSNGCEVNTTNSLTNCGACGVTCPSEPNATAACQSGSCTLACNAGYLNCNGNNSDGCETFISGDINNCGACGNACPSEPNAATACFGGVCQVGSCNPGYANCNGLTSDGCEVNIASDPSNCGGCGMVCNLANAVPACTSGSCQVAACIAGWGNCDAAPFNGCETNLQTSTSNCGSCGNVCPAGHACVSGVCQ